MTDIAMQFLDRHARIAQRRDLTDHVHAVADLRLGIDLDDLAFCIAIDALRRHPQATEVQIFEFVANFLGAAAGANQLATLVEKFGGEAGVGATRSEERRVGKTWVSKSITRG